MNACNFEIGIKPAPFHCFSLKENKLQSIESQPYYRKHYLLPTKSNNKMFTFIICELLLLITFIAGTSFCYKIHNKVRIVIQTLFQAIKSNQNTSCSLSGNIYQVCGKNKLLDKISESYLTKWL